MWLSDRKGKLRLLVAGMLTGLVALGGSCSLLLDFDPSDLLENTSGRCSDGVDNDDNGLTDCAEPDCAQFDFCQETSEEACRDRLDNDRDGLIDCEDSGCINYPRCTENKDGQCEDGNDNNDNGLEDCQDFTCLNAPACCHLQERLLDEPLTAKGACQPESCQLGLPGSLCNQFDPSIWISVGDPAPRVAGDATGFDPNRCDSCYLQGDCGCDAVLVTQDSFSFRSGLMIGAQLHVADGLRMRAGVALTWQTSFDEAAACEAAEPPVDRVAAAELTRDASSTVLTFLVDGIAERSLSWPSDSARVFVIVDADRFARFYVAEELGALPTVDASHLHRSHRPLPEAAASIRMALYGGGAGLRVSAAGVWDAARCHDPVPSRFDTFVMGAALSSGAAAWERRMVSDPAVVRWQGELLLFYVGREEASGLGSIGRAVLPDDEDSSLWVRDPDGVPVIQAGSLDGWPDPGTDLYGPAAVVLPDGRLALYFTLARRDGEEILWTGIVGAVSSDGVTFTPLETAEGDRVLLAPMEGVSWEQAVRDPSVDWRLTDGGPRFTMLYAGRSDPENPFTSQIGLATSEDGVHWQRGSVVPVVTPPQDALIHTAVSDPTLSWDGDLGIFRLWYVWRVGQQFSIYHAVATANALDWISFPGNPVLRSGDEVWCDDQYLDGPSVLLTPSGRLRFWYHGRSLTYGHSICYSENSIVE